MTDENTYELDLSAINPDDSTIRQLVAASETWNVHTQTVDAKRWIMETAIRALNVSKMLKEPISDGFFATEISSYEPVRAISRAVKVDQTTFARILRYIDVSTRGLVLATAYRLVAEIEIRASVAALVKERDAATLAAE